MITTATREMSRHLATETAELAMRLGRAPTATELAAAVGMNRDEVIDVLVAGSSCPPLPTDNALGSREVLACAGGLGDLVANLDRLLDREALRPLLAALPDGERTVVVLRFFASLTQTQIAERVGIPPMHVSRLLANALWKLREEPQLSRMTGAT